MSGIPNARYWVLEDIGSLITTQGFGDLYRIYATTQQDGLDFNIAYIGEDFVYENKKEQFETAFIEVAIRLRLPARARGLLVAQSAAGTLGRAVRDLGQRSRTAIAVRTRLAGFVLALLLASPVAAQGWDWRVTPYLWGVSIEGDVALGPVAREVDVEFSDVLNVLSGAALLHVEAEKDGRVAFGDLAWLAVEPEEEIATIGGVAEAELDSTIIELGYASTANTLGFEAGLRYLDLDLEIDPALAAGISRGDSWTDIFAGIRNTHDLGPNWTMTTRANLGAGGSDLAIGLTLDFARELDGGNAVVAGVRIIDIDYEQDNVRGVPFVLDTTFLGATLGFMLD